jgi:hypothetical protein
MQHCMLILKSLQKLMTSILPFVYITSHHTALRDFIPPQLVLVSS